MASTAATAATAAASPGISPVDEAWKVAQRVRVVIHKELEHIQNGGPGANEVGRFEKIEKLMENYRLACIETIWPDIRAAKEKGAEGALWQAHTHVAKVYRKTLERLEGREHVVLRGKLAKLYSTYLKTAQCFYRGYLQRVCARYDMKDLRRISQRAELEEMPVPDADKIDPAATQLEDIVKESCHKTLIFLGDLARYRTLLRPKDRKWEGALAYYFLANDLIPESGLGHHQCGVIYSETEDHLQVVYHMYRALACDKPHPNAPTNLEREFRDLLKRRNTGIKHALVSWFVKLHAFYAQGKEFAERKELESEVEHRMDAAMKTGTGVGSDMDLLKMVLINITAYVAAQAKIRAEWTEAGSRSCQFLLLLNTRTIQAVSRLLGDEIAELIRRRAAESTSDGSGSRAQLEIPGKFTPTCNRVLPLLRVYMAWLCSYGSELVEFRPHLEPQFGTMCATLSNTLTLLSALLGSESGLGNLVSFRFPEDEMTLGIRCLNGPDLRNGCQLYYDAFTCQPKPRLEDVSDANHTADDVTFTRAVDVVSCALDLSAPESKFPLTTLPTTKGSHTTTAFVYSEGGKPDLATSLQAPQHPAIVHSGATTATQPSVPANLEPTPGRPERVPSPELSEDEPFYGPSVRNVRSNRSVRGAAAAPAQAVPVSVFPIEQRLFRILDDFLSPPESAPRTNPQTLSQPPAQTSSSGMGMTAATEAPRAVAPKSPAPASTGPKSFPTLPWEYFHVPAPADTTLRNSTMSGRSPDWNADRSGFSRPTSSGSAAQLGGGAGTSTPRPRQAHSRYNSLGQNGPLESLDLGSASRTLANQPLHEHHSPGAWSQATRDAVTPGQAAFSAQHHDAWSATAKLWQTTPGQVPASDPVPHSPLASLQFSGNTSSLPPVNSPWGLPTRGQRFPAAAQSPSSPDARGGYAGLQIPSPSYNTFAASQPATGAYSAAVADEQEPRVSLSTFLDAQWQGARTPRSGSDQLLAGGEPWANPSRRPVAGGNPDAEPAMERMPKR